MSISIKFGWNERFFIIEINNATRIIFSNGQIIVNTKIICGGFLVLLLKQTTLKLYQNNMDDII